MFDEFDHPLEPGAPARPQGEPEPNPAHTPREPEASPAHPQGEPEVTPAHTADEPEATPAHTQGAPEVSPAQARFRACRWHAEADDQKYCSNRDVLPYAGKGGFDAEAWCPDCTFYKLRRTPKKQPRPEQDDYPY